MKKVKKKSPKINLPDTFTKDSDIIYVALVHFSNEIRLMTIEHMGVVKALGLVDELQGLMDYFDKMCSLRKSDEGFLAIVNYGNLLKMSIRFREIYVMLYSMSGTMSEAKQRFLSNLDTSIDNFKIAEEDYGIKSMLKRFKNNFKSENVNLD